MVCPNGGLDGMAPSPPQCIRPEEVHIIKIRIIGLVSYLKL